MEFRNLSIQDALKSEDYIIKTLAILDKRVGKRTLQKIKEAEKYKNYPEWARQFYELRLKEKKKKKQQTQECAPGSVFRNERILLQ